MSASPRRPPSADTGAIETIAEAYLAAAQGDARLALSNAIVDALADLAEAERRTHQRERLISRGFVRSALHGL